jgi:serine-type D-Ala-D-Ala carboxypeptidase/endopeptidase (penicillin-binding protein 4)
VRWLAGGLALLAVIAALVLALDGTLSHTSGRDSRAGAATRSATAAPATGTATAPAQTATTPTSPTLTPASARPAGPAARRLHRAMQAALAPAGPDVGALVYDISAGRELFAVHPTVARPPASVEKLWTTAALMDRLGPGARLHTALLGTGHERHGVWYGNLYLRGGGDPTFGDPEFNRVWNHGLGATPQALIDQLRRRGIRRVTGTVFGDESLFDRRRGGLITDLRPDVPDFGGRLSALDYDHGTTVSAKVGPAVFATRVFVQLMGEAGIAAHAARATRDTPRTADLLASEDSPPLGAMIRLMNVPSDDLFAELFCKQLGVLFGHGGTIADGAQVISDTLRSRYRLTPRVLDGSGLSRDDRTSPLQIVDLLRDTWHTPTGRELAASLPTVGVSGTVAGIGVKTAAQGRCLAKTGSLDDVTNLAGLCTARDGHVLAFGLFLDGPDNATGFALESRMVAAIARY